MYTFFFFFFYLMGMGAGHVVSQFAYTPSFLLLLLLPLLLSFFELFLFVASLQVCLQVQTQCL